LRAVNGRAIYAGAASIASEYLAKFELLQADVEPGAEGNAKRRE